MYHYLEVSRSDTVCLAAPDIVQKSAIRLSYGSAHSQWVISVDVFLVWLVASLGPGEVLGQRDCVAKTLHRESNTRQAIATATSRMNNSDAQWSQQLSTS